MMEVEFEILNMDAWMCSVASEHRCSIKILDCIPWNGKGGQAKFSIRAIDIENVLRDIRGHPDVCSVEAEKLADGSLIGTVGLNNCSLIRTILGAGCFLEWVCSEGDGKVLFKITAGSEGSIPDLFKKMDSLGLVVEIRKMVKHRPAQGISRRQGELIKTALEEGYYDNPRRITIKELAARFHTTPSSMRETLIRAEKGALEAYLISTDEQ